MITLVAATLLVLLFAITPNVGLAKDCVNIDGVVTFYEISNPNTSTLSTGEIITKINEYARATLAGCLTGDEVHEMYDELVAKNIEEKSFLASIFG